jgi:hypothetical protein
VDARAVVVQIRGAREQLDWTRRPLGAERDRARRLRHHHKRDGDHHDSLVASDQRVGTWRGGLAFAKHAGLAGPPLLGRAALVSARPSGHARRKSDEEPDAASTLSGGSVKAAWAARSVPRAL